MKRLAERRVGKETSEVYNVFLKSSAWRYDDDDGGGGERDTIGFAMPLVDDFSTNVLPIRAG